jgi:hypothetical protein
LLSEFPGALAHPAVITSVIKMRRLAANVEIAELAGDVNVDGEFFSAEACGAARDALHSIATALVSGLIGDGWSFTRRPNRRGRPKRSAEEIAESFDILGDYERVLRFLRATETKRGKRESEKQWRERLRGIVVQAWTQTIGVEIRSEPSPSKGDIFAGKIISVPLKLPDRVLDRCLDRALEAAGDGLPVRDVIAYHLVGHRLRAPSTIKSEVEGARKLDK